MQTETSTNSAAIRLRAILDEFGIPPEFGNAYSEVVYQRSVEQEPWSTASLLALQKDRSRPLNIDGRALPTVTYYSPLKALECAAETVLAVLHKDNPPLAALSALSALMALRGIATPVSQAETLLFLIVYQSESHAIPTEVARPQFHTEAKLHSGVSPADFDWALRSLEHLGCLWYEADLMRIADRVLLRN